MVGPYTEKQLVGSVINVSLDKISGRKKVVMLRKFNVNGMKLMMTTISQLIITQQSWCRNLFTSCVSCPYRMFYKHWL